jgi:hypothetical protein
MMTMKFIFVFGLAFSMFTHQTWGETDCYDEKVSVLHKCLKTLKVGGFWVHPSALCTHVVEESKMTCISNRRTR